MVVARHMNLLTDDWGDGAVAALGVAARQPAELVLGQRELERCEVLFKVVEGERAGDREHRGRAREQPRERDLLGRCTVATGDLGDGGPIRAAQREERYEH